MTRDDDLLSLSMCFEAARRYLGLRDRSTIVKNGLLSVMGACGATAVVLYEPETKDSRTFNPRSERGRPGISAQLTVTKRGIRQLLESPGPHKKTSAKILDAAIVKLCKREGFEVAMGLVGDEALHGILFLGPRLLGDAYRRENLTLALKLGDLLIRALRVTADEGAAKPRRRSAKSARQRLRQLREEEPSLCKIVGESRATLAVLEELIDYKDMDVPVLITGETGTGKGLVAQVLHELSSRAEESFEAVNCAAVPRELIASELFGHEKFAFTDAKVARRGVFERVSKGTVLLDEIGDMPLQAQTTLLRVLEEGEFCRLGSEQKQMCESRVISATNRDLTEAITSKQFRSDLFYRIRVLALHLPRLRERADDVPLLVEHFLKQIEDGGNSTPKPSKAFLARLSSLEFRGNVRQLRNLVLTAVARARGGERLLPDHLDESMIADHQAAILPNGASDMLTFEEAQRRYILEVLERTGGNRKEAARLMDIPRTTLNARIRKLWPDGGAP